jgi:carbon storage regulator
MLVLTRKDGETLLIGDDVKITIVKSKSGSVKIGVEAPREVKVLRAELQTPKEIKKTQKDVA